MPTKRTRISRNLIPDISPEFLAYLSDNLLGEKPEKESFELLLLSCDDREIRKLWNQYGPEILELWIERRPGTRPQAWWTHDAPRMSAEEIERQGWAGCYFAKHLPDPRRRLGGTGTAAHDVENLVPHFSPGIPDDWRDTDPANPPQFESQATYLRRHNLLEPCEERRLRPKDYEPEIVSVEIEDEETPASIH